MRVLFIKALHEGSCRVFCISAGEKWIRGINRNKSENRINTDGDRKCVSALHLEYNLVNVCICITNGI